MPVFYQRKKYCESRSGRTVLDAAEFRRARSAKWGSFGLSELRTHEGREVLKMLRLDLKPLNSVVSSICCHTSRGSRHVKSEAGKAGKAEKTYANPNPKIAIPTLKERFYSYFYAQNLSNTI